MADYKKEFILKPSELPYKGIRNPGSYDANHAHDNSDKTKRIFSIGSKSDYQDTTATTISQEELNQSIESFSKNFIFNNHKKIIEKISAKQSISFSNEELKNLSKDDLIKNLNLFKIAGIYDLNGNEIKEEVYVLEVKRPDILTITLNNQAYKDSIIETSKKIISQYEALFKYTLETFKEDPKIKGKSDSDLNNLFKNISFDTINTFLFRATETKLLNNRLVDDLGLLAASDKLDIFRFCSNTFFKDASGKIYTFPITQTYPKTLLTERTQTSSNSNKTYLLNGTGIILNETTDQADGSKCLAFDSIDLIKEKAVFTNLNISVVEAELTGSGNAGAQVPVIPARKDVEAVSDVINSISEGFNIYDQQCLLLKLTDRLIGDINVSKREKPRNQLPYDNFLAADIMAGIDDANAITNKINGAPEGFNDFVNIPNHVISAMRPKIRIFKTFTEGKKKIDVEIPLEQFVSPEDVLVGNVSRTFGYGLKSFSWDNTSFNEYDRNISATLVMKFNSLDAIVSERNGIILDKQLSNNDKEKYRKFRFLELIYEVPGKTNETQSADEAKKAATYNLNQKFKIKVALGWDADSNIISNLKTDKLSKSANAYVSSAKYNNIIYYLYNKGHDLKFEKDGSVTLSVFYQSAQEAAMSDEIQSNIFINKDIKTQLEKLSEQISASEQQLATSAGSNKKTLEDGLKDLRQKKENIINKNAFEIYGDFFNGLFKRDFLFNAIKMPVTNVIKYKAEILQPSDKQTQISYTSLNIYDDYEEERNKATNPKQVFDALKQKYNSSISKGDIVVPFFFLGDLLDYILESINRNDEQDTDTSKGQKERINLLTGPLIFRKFDQATIEELQKKGVLSPEEKNKKIEFLTNIADLPISLQFFLDWFEKKIVEQRLTRYTFRSFLSDLVNNFLTSALSPTCFGLKFRVTPYPKVDAFILNATLDNNKLERLTGAPIERFGAIRTTIQEISEKLSPSKNFENLNKTDLVSYLYLQAVYVDPLEADKIIDEPQNIKQGIFHLKVGADRGLVKNINFMKDDLQNLSVAIYQQQGSINPRVLRTPYNADVEMIGNTVFKPGMIVYIDPTFALHNPSSGNFGNDAVRFLGLGGFYVITRAQSSIQYNGQFTTRLTCRFTNYGITPQERAKKTTKAKK